MLNSEGFRLHNTHCLQAHYRYEAHRYHTTAGLFDLKIIVSIVLECITANEMPMFPITSLHGAGSNKGSRRLSNSIRALQV